MFTKEALKETLKENVVSVTFAKIDGTIRNMTCTLKQDLIPTYTPKSSRKKTENDNVLPVYDLTEKGFRSFRIDLVKEYQICNELCNPCETSGSGCKGVCIG